MNPLILIARNPVAAAKICGATLLIGYALYAHMHIGSLEDDLVTQRAENALLQDANGRLAASVEEQNQRVTQLQEQADARTQAVRDALQRAAGEVEGLQTEIQRIRAARGTTCADADALLNQALGL
jgi:hypothetical protein